MEAEMHFGPHRLTQACSRRLKSAFNGAARQASASADAKNPLPVGAGRPLAEGFCAD
jgi:hypothetical protein